MDNYKIGGKVYREGEAFEIVDGAKYCDDMKKGGAEVVMAEKKGCVIIRKGKPGEKILVWTQDGKLEAEEICAEGRYIVTRADLDGNVVIDSYGNSNEWQISEETLRKKYQVPADIVNGMFAKPKGGEQEFTRIDRNVVVMVPWGENGALVPEFVEKGGWLNSTNPKDVYGVAKAEFEETYTITR